MSGPTVPIPATTTDAGTGKPQIVSGEATSLVVSLQNATGDTLQLNPSGTTSNIAVKLPFRLFTSAQVGAMTVTSAGWTTVKVDPTAYTITVAPTGPSDWPEAGFIAFTISGVTSTAQANAQSVSIGLKGIGGKGVPLSTAATLAVVDPPTPGNLSLEGVLDVSLDNQGVIYRSSAADPLQNHLVLTLKNLTAKPIALADQRVGNPQVLVSFVYGSTSGALAPDDSGHGTPPAGSAWNIKVGLGPSQSSWTGTNPSPVGASTDPQWTLAPSPTNYALLGPRDSDSANVTFDFSPVVSFTPAGHTQMIVMCRGFAQSATKAYDDHVFVLDIPKLDAPPTRGLVAYSGTEPVVAVADPHGKVDLHLSWVMFDVAEVHLTTSKASVPFYRKTYSDPKPLDRGSHTLSFAAPATSEPIFTTLQALDGRGGFLNAMQFTAYAQVSYVKDPAGTVYPIALLGDTFWMLENYDYDPGGGTWVYDETSFGRLYDWKAASDNAPTGWSLPTQDDWNALFTLFGGGTKAYDALIQDGTSGFSARLGGQCDSSGTFSDQFGYGYYWTASAGAAQFSGTSHGVSFAPQDRSGGISVRYVRHA